jgi:hypothetical protein
MTSEPIVWTLVRLTCPIALAGFLDLTGYRHREMIEPRTFCVDIWLTPPPWTGGSPFGRVAHICSIEIARRALIGVPRFSRFSRSGAFAGSHPSVFMTSGRCAPLERENRERLSSINPLSCRRHCPHFSKIARSGAPSLFSLLNNPTNSVILPPRCGPPAGEKWDTKGMNESAN